MTDICSKEEVLKRNISNININCKYEKLGCEFTASLNNLEELKIHYREGMYKHLKMCYEEYAVLEEKFEQLRAIVSRSAQPQREEGKNFDKVQ